MLSVPRRPYSAQDCALLDNVWVFACKIGFKNIAGPIDSEPLEQAFGVH